MSLDTQGERLYLLMHSIRPVTLLEVSLSLLILRLSLLNFTTIILSADTETTAKQAAFAEHQKNALKLSAAERAKTIFALARCTCAIKLACDRSGHARV